MSKAKKKLKRAAKSVTKVVKKAAPYVAMGAAAYFGGSALLAGAAGAGGTAAATGAATGGMSWGALASGGLTALQTYQGYQEAQQAAKDLRAQGREQEAIDLENQIRMQEETAESIRRTREQQAITEGTTAARIGASGFASGSSLDRYMESMKQQHASDIDWMTKSGASQEQIAARESAARSRATQAQAKSASRGRWGALVQGGSSLAQQGFKYGWMK